MRLRVLLLVALAGAVTAAAIPTSSARSLARTWSGTWSTNFGTMTLKQSGSSVEGNYTHDKGHLSGTVSGNVLRGKWDEAPTRAGPGDAGDFEFTLSANGKSWSGRWRYARPGDAWKTDWRGTCSAGPCHGGSGDQPVKIDIRYHANNLPTAPPADGGRCSESRVAARVTGTITAQITPRGDHQGGGDVVATPHLNRCRVPVINVQVQRVQLTVLTPGRILRARLTVKISQEGTHRPGDCGVSTLGTIVATFDDTARAANALPNHSLRIGPWGSPCSAHNHLITNNISSIPAGGSSSTWVRVWIGCVAEGTGYGPRNCEG